MFQVKTFETQFPNLYQEYQSSNRKARTVLTSAAKSLYLRMILFPYFRKHFFCVIEEWDSSGNVENPGIFSSVAFSDWN